MTREDKNLLVKDIRQKNQSKSLLSVICALLVTFCLYCAAVATIMRFRHPEYTETELFLSLGDAIVWNFK